MSGSEKLEGRKRAEEAAKMQQAVTSVCEQCFGQIHLETLKARERLVHIVFQQGLYTKARSLQEEVVIGYSSTLGPEHEDTLKAKELYARAISKFWKIEDFDLASTLYRQAISGLKEIHGPDNLDMLIAKEGLARMLVDIGGESYFDEADLLITDVLERRTRTLGKEHPYTLLAMVHAAIIKCGRGNEAEAEELLRTGLAVADRSLGRDHVGTLMGRLHLGHVLLQRGRTVEAEEVLLDTTERQKYMQAKRGAYHPDRVAALIELAKCYRLQGKIELSIQTCDEAVDGFETWGRNEHPLAVDLREARAKLVAHRDSVRLGGARFEDISKPIKGVYRPWHVF